MADAPSESEERDPRRVRKDELRQLPPRAIALFALRAALRAFPFLVPEGRSMGSPSKSTESIAFFDGLHCFIYLCVCGHFGAAAARIADDAARAAATRAAAISNPYPYAGDAAADAAADAARAAARAADAADAADAAARAATDAAARAATDAYAAARAADAYAADKAARLDYGILSQYNINIALGFPLCPGYRSERIARWLRDFVTFCNNNGLADTGRRTAQIFAGTWPSEAELREVVTVWAKEKNIPIEWMPEGQSFWEGDNAPTSSAGSTPPESSARQLPDDAAPTPGGGDAEEEKTPPESAAPSVESVAKEEALPPLGVATLMADELGTVDRLGRTRLVTALTDLLTRPEQSTPMTIALLADWGAGKTMLMELVKARIAEREAHAPGQPGPRQTRVTTFNAWSYEQTSDMAAGLAQEVMNTLICDLSLVDRLKLQARFAFREHPARAWTYTALAALALFWLGAWGLSALLPDPPKDTSVLARVSGWFRPEKTETWYESLGLGPVILLIGALVLAVERAQKIMAHPFVGEIFEHIDGPVFHQHLGLVHVLRRYVKFFCEARLEGPGEAVTPTHGYGRQILVEELLPTARRWGRAAFEKALACLTPRRDRAQHREVWGSLLGWPWLCTWAERARHYLFDTQPLGRLVVFVDDLDRCSPKSIVRAFEAIRLVMDIQHVIVIIAVDDRIAFRAVAEHYRDLATSTRPATEIARDYLGKIIQVPITLSPPDASSFRQFIDEELFAQLHEEESAAETTGNEERSAAPAAVGGEIASNEPKAHLRADTGSATAPNVFADAPLTLAEKPLALPDVKDPQPRQGTPPAPTPIERETLTAVLMRETLDEREHFAALVEGFQFNNPRQMKRLRNTYRLLKVLDHQRSNMQRLKRKMTMLFWQEYLHTAPESAAKAWEDELRAAIKPLSVAAPPESTPEPGTPPLPFTAESAFASPAAAKAAPMPLAPEFLKFLLETFALDGAEGVQAYDTLAGKVVGYVLPRGLL